MARRKPKEAAAAKPEYKLTPREVAIVAKVDKALAEKAPRLKIKKVEGYSIPLPEHPDERAGLLLLMEAVGTNDLDFLGGLLTQLTHAGPTGSEFKEHDLNFLLSVVKGIKPRDQMEAMLAAQMAAVHTATMQFSRNLAAAEYLEHRDSAERTFNKLARTYLSQMEALKRYRTGGEQTVTVQHVNVGEGGQAIVGNVTQGQGNAAPGEAPARPLALTHDKTMPMPIIESKQTDPVPASKRAKQK
jgi:hypothetical protein